MAFLIRPQLWLAKQQPTVAVEIDWTHPIASRMVLCLLAKPGGGLVDLTNRTRTLVGLGTWNIRPSGVAFDGWNIDNASSVDLAFTSGPWAVGAFSHLTAVSVTSGQNPASFSRTSYTSETVNSGWYLGQQGLASPVWECTCFANNGSANYTISGTSTAAVGDVFLGQTSNGSTTRRLIVNGKQEGSSALNLNPLSSSSLLNTFTSGVGAFDGSYLLLAWNRDVSLGEWAWLAAEPFCFLRPRIIIVPRSAGVNLVFADTGASFDVSLTARSANERQRTVWWS